MTEDPAGTWTHGVWSVTAAWADRGELWHVCELYVGA